MRGEILRLYKSVHTWTGLVTGMLLFICFYAGALTIFSEPLAHWASPPTGGSISVEDADRLIETTLAARPEAAKDFTLRLATASEPARLSWRKSRNDDVVWSATLGADGELRVDRSNVSGVGAFVDTIHRTAGLPLDRETGTTAMGVVSAVYAVALISGLILVLPSLAKDLLALRLTTNLKRMWLDAHNLVGVASFPFHLVIALTAVVFGLHEPIYDALDHVVYDGRLPTIMRSTGPFAGVKRDEQKAPMKTVAELVAVVVSASPNFSPTSLHYRDADTRGALVRVIGEDPRFLSRGGGFAVVRGATAEVVNVDYLPEKQSGWTAAVSPFFALHFGSYGGEPVRWAYFSLGLAGAFLFYSGNLLWIESRRRTARRHGEKVVQTTAARLMAAASIGVCLGCVCALSFAIVSTKWLYGHVEDVDAWRRGIYHAVFFGALAFALVRGAARAGVELACVAALGALALPVTSAVAWAAPGLGPWAAADPESAGVDIVGLIAALCFAALARATARRAERGPTDSVWSAREASRSARSPLSSNGCAVAVGADAGDDIHG
ncbi:PepSY domain-containing protein [Methylosinus sp. Sm6]|uniref:PepSY-associated TM helix domain-containing protein n=1 Tax=Methylosinus sp. Sm6 TaxID=2866948 RepID=UPI001C99EA19|nr:PepSY-associated TM helix domain-containing protein [Methylosinus sp. Sm6]MBY6240088.1 PepSY domain-containing protein [Methylosinus sp. Sm6]